MSDKKKKILFLEQYAKLTGGQRVLISLIKGLSDNYDPCVIVPGKGTLTEELEHLNIDYVIFPIGYYTLGKKTIFDIFNYMLRLPLLIQKLRRLIKTKNIDLVYANGARTFVWGTIACSMTKTPMVWHIHSIFVQGLSKNLCIFFGKNKIVKKVIAVSKAAKRPLGALNGKIEVIYNAVDTNIYFPAHNHTGSLRDKLDLGQDLLIAMVGFLMEWKGVDDLIRAAKIVTSKYPQTRFVIVGDVLYDKKGKRYKQYLMDLVTEFRLDNNVLFAGYRNDIPEIMRQLDILVLASKQPDPCPTSVIQAMASDTAVIASNFGGPAEIICNGKDGLLYTPGNYEELAEKILFLLNNPRVRKDISYNASQRIKQNFNQIDYLSKIKKIIVKANGEEKGL